MTANGGNGRIAPKYSVLIAEDHALFGQGLKLGLEQTGMCGNIRLAKNGVLALEAIAEEKPDLMLVDIRMPEMDGLALSRAVKTEHPDIKIIMLTSVNDPESIRRALSAGVDGYSSKEISLAHLRDIIQMVMRGAIWLGPLLARQVLREMATQKPDPVKMAKLGKAVPPPPPLTSGGMTVPPIPAPQDAGSDYVLTARDIQILTLIADYKSNIEIANALGISEAWIDGYIRNILEKMSVNNEIEAVRKAVDEGVLTGARLLEQF